MRHLLISEDFTTFPMLCCSKLLTRGQVWTTVCNTLIYSTRIESSLNRSMVNCVRDSLITTSWGRSWFYRCTATAYCITNVDYYEYRDERRHFARKKQNRSKERKRKRRKFSNTHHAWCETWRRQALTIISDHGARWWFRVFIHTPAYYTSIAQYPKEIRDQARVRV